MSGKEKKDVVLINEDGLTGKSVVDKGSRLALQVSRRTHEKRGASDKRERGKIYSRNILGHKVRYSCE